MTDRAKRYTKWLTTACPKCGDTDVRVTRTMPVDGFGCRDRYCKCRACQWTFVATEHPSEKVSSN